MIEVNFKYELEQKVKVLGLSSTFTIVSRAYVEIINGVNYNTYKLIYDFGEKEVIEYLIRPLS